MISKLSDMKEIPNRQILCLADEHYSAVKLLDKSSDSLKGIRPIITYASFTLELYLKCLNAKTVFNVDAKQETIFTINGQLSGGRITAEPECNNKHSLTKSWNEIPNDVQKEIRRYYKKTSLNKRSTQICDFLKKFNGVFVSSRYSFEEGKSVDEIGYSDLIELVDFFHNTINKLEPIMYY